VPSQRGERAPQAKFCPLMTKPCDIKAEFDAKKSSIVQPNLFCEGKAKHQSSEHVIPVFGLKFVILAG
jgi:hypothetical protein